MQYLLYAGTIVSLLITPFCELGPSSEVTPSLRLIGNMDVARAAHTATTLPDGRVLVVGGMTVSERDLARAIVLRVDREIEITRLDAVVNRQSHTATLLKDGLVLITGGFDTNGNPMESTELFNPKSNQFEVAASMNTARAAHRATRLKDGRVLLVGGVSNDGIFLRSTEIYSPSTNTFSSAGMMNAPRASHTATLLQTGEVLVVGGHAGARGDLSIYDTAELFDPLENKFRLTDTMASPRHKHDSVLLADGRVLVIAGSDQRDSRGVYRSTEFYDPQVDEFSPGPNTLLGRYKHRGTSILQSDGSVALLGGATVAELFDANNGSSTTIESDSSLPGMFSAAAKLSDGRILLLGGYGSDIRTHAGIWILE